VDVYGEVLWWITKQCAVLMKGTLWRGKKAIRSITSAQPRRERKKRKESFTRGSGRNVQKTPRNTIPTTHWCGVGGSDYFHNGKGINRAVAGGKREIQIVGMGGDNPGVGPTGQKHHLRRFVRNGVCSEEIKSTIANHTRRSTGGLSRKNVMEKKDAVGKKRIRLSNSRRAVSKNWARIRY